MAGRRGDGLQGPILAVHSMVYTALTFFGLALAESVCAAYRTHARPFKEKTMARKRTIAPAKQKTQAIVDNTATAMASALGFALEEAQTKRATRGAGEVSSLAALCDQAADHMALAHNLLVTHENHTDTAIEHLDAALGCLKELVAEGEKRQAAKKTKPGRKTRRRKSA